MGRGGAESKRVTANTRGRRYTCADIYDIDRSRQLLKTIRQALVEDGLAYETTDDVVGLTARRGATGYSVRTGDEGDSLVFHVPIDGALADLDYERDGAGHLEPTDPDYLRLRVANALERVGLKPIEVKRSDFEVGDGANVGYEVTTSGFRRAPEEEKGQLSKLAREASYMGRGDEEKAARSSDAIGVLAAIPEDVLLEHLSLDELGMLARAEFANGPWRRLQSKKAAIEYQIS